MIKTRIKIMVKSVRDPKEASRKWARKRELNTNRDYQTLKMVCFVNHEKNRHFSD